MPPRKVFVAIATLSGLTNHENNVLSRLQSRLDFGKGIGIADGLAVDFEDDIAASELDGIGEASGLDIEPR